MINMYLKDVYIIPSLDQLISSSMQDMSISSYSKTSKYDSKYPYSRNSEMSVLSDAPMSPPKDSKSLKINSKPNRVLINNTSTSKNAEIRSNKHSVKNSSTGKSKSIIEKVDYL